MFGVMIIEDIIGSILSRVAKAPILNEISISVMLCPTKIELEISRVIRISFE
jgi:hypothetical protein